MRKPVEETASRRQIAWNLTPLEYRQFEEAADAQGVRPGTLVNALLDSLLPMLRESGYSVPRLREMIAKNKSASDQSGTAVVVHTVKTPSTFQQWGYGFVDDMYAKNDTQPLLMLADHQRYKRPDDVSAGNADARPDSRDEKRATRSPRKAIAQ